VRKIEVLASSVGFVEQDSWKERVRKRNIKQQLRNKTTSKFINIGT
jgi:hypothetical protein